ncbi:MFS transporter [Microbacterium excoecariae]|uniref:MFS transporter n=1 Tax=Microbacterium excoecariae TaxID=2715210 RepID=UPI001408193E|nr:MFS transporter [Microbacterium excoecariae]
MAFVAVFVAGATPIPLYDTYRTENGVTNVDLSLVAVCYFVCAIFGLLVLGRLSNHLGRKPVSMAAVAIAILGCLVYLVVDEVAPLLVGRGLQGLAAGVASSAIAAFVVDTGPAKHRWLVTSITSAGATVGLAIGAFGAGALVDFAPLPRLLSYLAATVLLGIAFVLLATSTETVLRRPGVFASVRPRLGLPVTARPFVPAAFSVFIATWAYGGYFQAFGPSVAADYLHSSSALVAAAIFASWMAPGVFGGPIADRMRPATALRISMIVVLIAAAGLVGAIFAGSAVLFVSFGVLGGLGMGIGTAGAMRSLLPAAAPSERAGLLSLIYAASYLGGAIPALIAGQLSQVIDLFTITAGYAAIAVAAFVIVMTTARNPPEVR